ncbi:hypothetical protein UA08_07987 [Talaromyces atroroseus]|uniref:Uncharacterized protein n=1 Tax=Talaromyces atroroseus TaxID=1441469 RepID=A0A225A819_TALAT|nr:hypothetical protein UA08_07987 [Talaromyces atroroseus]OKL56851.1 hypothetical protein UA08_07987 [Talaromyces atroroseus]
MYGWWHSLAVVTLLAPTVYTANIIPKNERCVTAVYTALNYVSFIGEPKAGLWLARCQNSLKVTSIYAGAEIYCDEKERAAGFAQLNTLCQESANVGLIPRQNVAENLTKESIEQMRRVEFGEVPRNGQLDYPVLLSTAYYNRTFRTIVGFLRTLAQTQQGCEKKES